MIMAVVVGYFDRFKYFYACPLKYHEKEGQI
jgi:hypothetical protein